MLSTTMKGSPSEEQLLHHSLTHQPEEKLMKKLNQLLSLSLLCAANLAFATEGSEHPTRVVGGNGLSIVTVQGTTSAQATGGTVSAYGRSTVDGTHVGPNGTTHFVGDVGAQGAGQGRATAQTELGFVEVRGTSGGGMRVPSHGHEGMNEGRRPYGSTMTSFVVNGGNMASSATGSDAKSVAWGDMSNSGNLTGMRGSNLNFTQQHGYEATGSTTVNGSSHGNYGAQYTITVGRRP